MVNEFKFPDVGEGITEGKIQQWRVRPGDAVKEDQIIADIETDKAVVEMPAPVTGKVLEIRIPQGGIVKVGEVLVVIGGEDGEVEEKTPGATEAQVPLDKGMTEELPERKIEMGRGAVAMPGIRKRAKEMGLDIEDIKATGHHGQVTKEDLEKERIEEPGSAKGPKVRLSYDLYGHIEHIPYEGVRAVIGKKLSESKFKAPHAVAMEEADISELWSLRQQLKEYSIEKGAKLSVLAFAVGAVVKALKKHPFLNAFFDEGNKDIVLKKYYNIGIAVDSPDGLKVPVIKKAEIKGIFEVQKEINDLAKKAREKKIDLMDMQGSSFSISNYGSIAGIYGVPIINLGDVAILGLGRARDLPRVINGEIIPRKIVGLSVSFDHRVVDGAEVARFLNTLKGYLENPVLIIID